MRLLVQSLLRGCTPSVRATRRWRAALLVLFIAVAYLALTPQPPKQMDTGWDKLNHVLAFAALAFAGCMGWPQARDPRKTLLLGLLFLGAAIEVLQLIVPGRASEWSDLLADAIGIGCGGLLATYILSATSAAVSTESAKL